MPTAGGYTPPSAPPCAYSPRMTRAAALALRTAGTLNENCIVVITDGPTIGTVGNTSVTEITLQPTSPTELSEFAEVNTTFDNVSWRGLYDIDANSITELTDSSGNTAKDVDAASNTVHAQFPWHLGTTLGGSFRDNYVEDSILTGWPTQVDYVTGNKISGSTFDLTGKTAGTINDNDVGPGANLTLAGVANVSRNKFRTSDGAAHLMVSNIAGATLTMTECDLDADFAVANTLAGGVMTLTEGKFTGHQGGIFEIQNAAAGTITVAQTEIIQIAGNNACIRNDAAPYVVSVNRSKMDLGGINIAAGAAGNFTMADSELTVVGGVAFTDLTVAATQTGAINLNFVKVNGSQHLFTGAAATIRSCEFTEYPITVGPAVFNATRCTFNFGTYNNNIAPAGATGAFNISDSIIRFTNFSRTPASSAPITISSGCDISDTNINQAAAATGTGMIISNAEIRGGSTATTLNQNSTGGVTIQGGNINELILNHSGAGIFSSIDSDILFSTFNKIAGSTANWTLTNGTMVNNCTNTQAAGATSGALSYVGSNIQNATITQNGPGPIDINISTVANGSVVNNTAAATRGLQILRSIVSGSTVSEQRTLNTNFDIIDSSQILGASSVISSGAAGGAGNTNLLVGTMVRGGSTVNLTDTPSGTDLGNSTIEGQSTLNLQAGGFMNRSRIGQQATVNSGAFGHDGVIIELNGTTTLTAANTNRLRNKAFSDVI